MRGWSRENGALRLGAGLTYSEVEHGELSDVLPALAEASRTVGSPQIRNRGTIGGNLGTASPAGDALPPLVVEGAQVECASVRGVRTVPLLDFVIGVKRNVLEPDELITAVRLIPSETPQTFMKVGPRNAMVISVVALAVSGGDELRACFGSASPRPVLVTAPRDEAGTFPRELTPRVAQEGTYLERRPEGLGDTLADALRHRARLLAHHRGEQHRRVAREVAEVGSGRALQLGAGDRRAAELGGGRPHGLLEGADRIGRPAVGGRLRARGGHAP